MAYKYWYQILVSVFHSFFLPLLRSGFSFVSQKEMPGDGVVEGEEVGNGEELRGRKASWGTLRRLDSLDVESGKIPGRDGRGRKVRTLLGKGNGYLDPGFSSSGI